MYLVFKHCDTETTKSADIFWHHQSTLPSERYLTSKQSSIVNFTENSNVGVFLQQYLYIYRERERQREEWEFLVVFCFICFLDKLDVPNKFKAKMFQAFPKE